MLHPRENIASKCPTYGIDDPSNVKCPTNGRGEAGWTGPELDGGTIEPTIHAEIKLRRITDLA